jgi:transposase/quercetin dioxygenase-like cupin family protein
MRTTELTDAQWQCLQPLLPPPRKGRGRPRADDRRTLNGVLYVLRTGCRWEDVPRRYGSPATCWRRLRAWEKDGTWECIWRRLLTFLDQRKKLEWAKAFLDGSFVLLETVCPPEGGPPPHVHYREDETFYVIEGEMEFLLGDDTVRAVAGSFVHVPKGTMHTFKNVGMTLARFLVTVVPGGFEKFFFEAGERATDKSTPPVPEGPPDVENLVATAAKYNCEIPPPQAH